MKKNKQIYICTSCNAVYARWQGECIQCHQWNTIAEDFETQTITTKIKTKNVVTTKLSDVAAQNEHITKINMPGVENVLGGGIHRSQIILLSGEPGIGKSTLLLQIVKNYPHTSVYISGEESLYQLAKRAERLIPAQVTNNFSKTEFVSSTDLNVVLSLISSNKYDLVIIDSIQTVMDTDSGGFAGSINQVRLCTFKITEIAKKHNVSVIIIGQITKEGDIAGPKMMEHLVDTVLYFEGDRKSDLRILKSYKNRFGSVGETVIFEMKQDGLQEIIDPGRYFLVNQSDKTDGVAFSIVADGSMTYGVEVQALVNKSFFPIPKRLATNYDNNRLQMLLAVMQKKLNLALYENDIYVNISGGIKVNDTSADLAVCAAIISSMKNKSLNDVVFIGEVGLTGAVQRTVRHESKLKQAQKLGFKKIISQENLENIKELVSILLKH